MKNYIQECELYFTLKATPPSSQESYLRRIKAFVGFIEAQGKNLEQIDFKDIQAYILYLKQDKALSAGTINAYISSIRFLYTYVLDREWNSRKVPRMKRTVKMPVIPPREVVERLLEASDNIKHRAILSLLFGSGLRVSEVCHLKIKDICSKTMRVRVENAKHGTDRYTILSKKSLALLRTYYQNYFKKGYRPEDWLFPGQKPGLPLNVKTVKNTIIKLKDKLVLDADISAHTLRHCFATYLLEDDVEVEKIRQLLGHRCLSSTKVYLQLTAKSLMGIVSPLDRGAQP
jgi:integrase/recombinase XerD